MSVTQPRQSRQFSFTPAALIEGLEGRTLMAATPLAVAEVAYQGGLQLRVSGTAKADQITVRQTAGGLEVANATGWAATFAGSYKSLLVNAGVGNDIVTLDESVTVGATLRGGAGNDRLTGGAGDDSLYGEEGTDQLNGGAGDDVLVAVGGGNDRATGAAGRDSFWVDAGSKEVVADASADENAAGAVHRVGTFLDTSVAAAAGVNGRAAARYADAPAGESVGGRLRGFKSAKKAARTAKAANPFATTELSGARLADPAVTDPNTIAYTKFADRPLFADAGPSADDVAQGAVGDCYYLVALASLAKDAPQTIRESVVDLGDGTYAVQFTQNNGTKVFVRVDNDLPTYKWSGGRVLAYAGLGAEGSVWVAVMEKAWAFFRTGAGTYDSIAAGWMDESYSALGVASQNAFAAPVNGQALLNQIRNELAAGRSVTYAVGTPAAGSNLVGYHAYTVEGVGLDGNGNPATLRLRNPWAKDGYVSTDGANDGYLTVSAEHALASFLGMTSAAV